MTFLINKKIDSEGFTEDLENSVIIQIHLKSLYQFEEVDSFITILEKVVWNNRPTPIYKKIGNIILPIL